MTMNDRTVERVVADALDALLSLDSTPSRHATALSEVEAVVAPLALSPRQTLVDAFLRSQDSIETNRKFSLSGSYLEERLTPPPLSSSRVWFARMARTRLDQQLHQGHGYSSLSLSLRPNSNYT